MFVLFPIILCSHAKLKERIHLLHGGGDRTHIGLPMGQEAASTTDNRRVPRRIRRIRVGTRRTADNDIRRRHHEPDTAHRIRSRILEDGGGDGEVSHRGGSIGRGAAPDGIPSLVGVSSLLAGIGISFGRVRFDARTDNDRHPGVVVRSACIGYVRMDRPYNDRLHYMDGNSGIAHAVRRGDHSHILHRAVVRGGIRGRGRPRMSRRRGCDRSVLHHRGMPGERDGRGSIVRTRRRPDDRVVGDEEIIDHSREIMMVS